MRNTFSILLLVVIAACTGDMPPPPSLTVTSPTRGLVQPGAGVVEVKGTTEASSSGSPVSQVTVNGVQATLAADGSFTATVNVPAGASLLETRAISEEGGAATDARAVQVGQLRPVGTNIERAVTASLSKEAFAKLSAAAGPILKNTDLTAMLAPMQPMASLGDSIANVKLSINKLSIGDARIMLTPVAGGLQFSATIDTLSFAAKAAYGGALVPDGSTSVTVTADQITIAGTLVVTPAGVDGFTTKITSPTVRSTNLRLGASGLIGQILDLLNNNLASTVQGIITKTTERALEPLINVALGALAGPQSIDVVGKTLDLEASPSVVTFTNEGALVTMNLAAKIAGSESSPGYIFTPNGVPTMDVSSGIQLGLSDDLLNNMLAQVHALKLLDLRLAQDFGLFDVADIKLSMPPMISANNTDGSLRLVLGDMIASFSNDGKPVISAAVNAEIELAILRGTNANEIALKFGKIHVWVNVLPNPTNAEDDGGYDLAGAATQGIGIQLESLSQFLITVPVPSVAGVSLDNLAMRADSGYVVLSGQVH